MPSNVFFNIVSIQVRGEREWGEWKEHFQAKTINFSHIIGDISFLFLFVTASQTFFILDILDIGERTYKRWRTETSAKRPVTH